ncbi:MAG: heavy-metal-associated domain-containing protein [Clostridiales bacterium]|nr:heavy-metal-associated domain-containing protein [Eubacteriales bacterium]MDH7567086.1 heavy-metal-associated domain-containing protein [Clostridiales bacterium]
METTVIHVPSISCSACANKIQEGVRQLNGIGGVAIDLKSQAVKVNYNPSQIQPSDIRRKISSMGYEVIQ